MECRDEDDLVIVFQLIVTFPLQLPIRIVDQDKNTRPSSIRVSASVSSQSKLEAKSTNTVPFSIKSSSRSFSRLSRSQNRRYVTSAGFWGDSEPSADVEEEAEDADAGAGTSAGRSMRCERWFEKSSSRPPPNSIFSDMVDMPVT